MRRKSLVVLVVFLMATSLVGPRSTSAHNIDLKKAREVASLYPDDNEYPITATHDKFFKKKD